MPRIKVWADDEILYSSDLNAEFDNVLAQSVTPDSMDDCSDDVLAMQTATDPYPAGAPALPISLRGEIQRLRYLIKQITGETYWYVDPDTTIAALLLSGLPRAAAGGTSEAITADYTPDVTLSDQTIVAVVAGAANTTTTPTFAPDGLTAHTITKFGGNALIAGDISGAGHVLLLEYNLANTRWELLNPAGTPFATAAEIIAGTVANKTIAPDQLKASYKLVPPGTIISWPTETPPDGYLECDGSAISRATYVNLFSVISDDYGNGDGSTTFNVPNYKGRFLRGWDHGAGIDPDAATRMDRGDTTTGDHVGTKQANQYMSHAHTNSASASYQGATVMGGTGALPPCVYADAPGSKTVSISVTVNANGGNETRPTNTNVMFCIKY